VILSLLQTTQSTDNARFVQKIQEIDQIRSQDFGLAHREIAMAMGYVLN